MFSITRHFVYKYESLYAIVPYISHFNRISVLKQHKPWANWPLPSDFINHYDLNIHNSAFHSDTHIPWMCFVKHRKHGTLHKSVTYTCQLHIHVNYMSLWCTLIFNSGTICITTTNFTCWSGTKLILNKYIIL